jgi:transcriptional regulator with XRE-family HTH domain
MAKTLTSPRHEALRALLVEMREKAGLSQAEVARRLGQYQSFVARVEGGQRRVDVVEFLDFADAISFDPQNAIRRLLRVRS